MYNYHYEISELLDDGMSYEEACALCEFVFGESEYNENEKTKRKGLSLRTKKWLEKTARKTTDRKEKGNGKI